MGSVDGRHPCLRFLHCMLPGAPMCVGLGRPLVEGDSPRPGGVRKPGEAVEPVLPASLLWAREVIW